MILKGAHAPLVAASEGFEQKNNQSSATLFDTSNSVFNFVNSDSHLGALGEAENNNSLHSFLQPAVAPTGPLASNFDSENSFSALMNMEHSPMMSAPIPSSQEGSNSATVKRFLF